MAVKGSGGIDQDQAMSVEQDDLHEKFEALQKHVIETNKKHIKDTTR